MSLLDDTPNSTITVGDIASAIENFAPLNLQESYDNAGLQVGDKHKVATGVLLCLDLTDKILDEAIAKGCNVVVSHHPLIFHGVKQIAPDTSIGRIIIKAIKHDIAIYAAHTNMDNACNGVSHQIASMIGLQTTEVLQQSGAEGYGSGVIGAITPTTLGEILRKLKETFNVKTIRYSGNMDKTISKVALCGGAGAFLIGDAVARGADLYITGDVKYHDFTAHNSDIAIADIGHYESELCTKSIFYRIISEKFPNFAINFSQEEKNPINYL